MMELCIKGGSVYTDGRFVQTDVVIEDDRIAHIGTGPRATRTVDACGLRVLPGLIDPHVHLAMPAANGHHSADDFTYGGWAAAYGGVTTVIDFIDEATTIAELKTFAANKRSLIEKGVVDAALHAAMASPGEDADQIMRAIHELGLTGLKLYTTYKNAGIYSDYETILRLMKAAQRAQIPILVHAEADEWIDHGAHTPIDKHGIARPPESERAAVEKLCDMCRQTGCTLYIVHVSCGSTVDMVQSQYGNLLDRQLYLETAPHYLLWNDEKLMGQDGYRYTMTPPLRPKAEQQRLYKRFDALYTIGTDHCPFTLSEKQHTYTADIPMGVGGLSDAFCALYPVFGDALIDKYTKHPATIFGLAPDKGAIAVGAYADLFLYDETATPNPTAMGSRCDYGLYEGLTRGRIVRVMRRGEWLVKNGRRNRNCSAGQYMGVYTSS